SSRAGSIGIAEIHQDAPFGIEQLNDLRGGIDNVNAAFTVRSDAFREREAAGIQPLFTDHPEVIAVRIVNLDEKTTRVGDENATLTVNRDICWRHELRFFIGRVAWNREQQLALGFVIDAHAVIFQIGYVKPA